LVLRFGVDLCGSSASLIAVSQFNPADLSPSLVEHPSGRDAQPGCPGDALPLGRGVDQAKQIGVQAHVDDRLLAAMIGARSGDEPGRPPVDPNQLCGRHLDGPVDLPCVQRIDNGWQLGHGLRILGMRWIC